MSQIAGLGLPSDGELIACKGMVYQWDVLAEIDDHYEQWGWVLFCPVVDLGAVYGVREIEVVDSLPMY